MKALVPLAVVERDILALRTARENRATLKRLNWTRACLALSVHQDRTDRPAPQPRTATSLPSRLRCSSCLLRSSSLARLRRAHESARQRAPPQPNYTATAPSANS